MNEPSGAHESIPLVRLAALLMAAGQVVFILSTLLHAGGDANDHQSIFPTYAHDVKWSGVHLGQFISMAIFLGGLNVLNLSTQRSSIGRIVAALSGATTIVALSLYGVLQAVDGVALKHAVDAWAIAPEAERATRFCFG